MVMPTRKRRIAAASALLSMKTDISSTKPKDPRTNTSRKLSLLRDLATQIPVIDDGEDILFDHFFHRRHRIKYDEVAVSELRETVCSLKLQRKIGMMLGRRELVRKEKWLRSELYDERRDQASTTMPMSEATPQSNFLDEMQDNPRGDASVVSAADDSKSSLCPKRKRQPHAQDQLPVKRQKSVSLKISFKTRPSATTVGKSEVSNSNSASSYCEIVNTRGTKGYTKATAPHTKSRRPRIDSSYECWDISTSDSDVAAKMKISSATKATNGKFPTGDKPPMTTDKPREIPETQNRHPNDIKERGLPLSAPVGAQKVVKAKFLLQKTKTNAAVVKATKDSNTKLGTPTRFRIGKPNLSSIINGAAKSRTSKEQLRSTQHTAIIEPISALTPPSDSPTTTDVDYQPYSRSKITKSPIEKPQSIPNVPRPTPTEIRRPNPSSKPSNSRAIEDDSDSDQDLENVPLPPEPEIRESPSDEESNADPEDGLSRPSVVTTIAGWTPATKGLRLRQMVDEQTGGYYYCVVRPRRSLVGRKCGAA